MITLNDYISASGKYPERAFHPECTPDVRLNARDLLARVNDLLTILGISAKVASGFRPSQVNARIKGAAKFSKHMSGLAVDLQDLDGEIARRIQANKKLLDKYDLYMEKPTFTKGWVHLQSIRTRSGLRIFIP